MATVLNRINILLIVLYVLFVFPLWIGVMRGAPLPWPGVRGVGDYVAAQRQKIFERSKITTLNLFMPSSYSSLVDLLNARIDPKSVDFDRHTDYYRAAASILPKPMNADAYAMLAYCYYQQGKTKEALANYLKSFEENPTFIWTQYNLAVIAFKSQDYEKVVFLTQRLLKENPEDSVKTLLSSKIYTDVLRAAEGKIDVPQEIKKVYSDAAQMLAVSYARVQSKGSVTPEDVLNAQDLSVRFF